MKKLIGTLTILLLFVLFSCGPRPETTEDQQVYEDAEKVDKETGMPDKEAEKVEREVGERSPAKESQELERRSSGEPEMIERSADRDQNALDKSIERDHEQAEEKKPPAEQRHIERE